MASAQSVQRRRAIHKDCRTSAGRYLGFSGQMCQSLPLGTLNCKRSLVRSVVEPEPSVGYTTRTATRSELNIADGLASRAVRRGLAPGSIVAVLGAHSWRCRLSRLEEGVEFATNPDPRCPCLLLLDTSGSMQGEPIANLNSGLVLFQTDLQQDELARRRCEVAVVTFGGTVSMMQDFVTADHYYASQLTASGQTPMGAAMLQGLQMIRERKAKYRQAGIDYYRPWMFLITDGEPTDPWEEATRQVHAEVANSGMVFFAVGVPPRSTCKHSGRLPHPAGKQ